MKRIKKILVGLIAMVMLVGAGMSVFAADGAQITAISSIKDAAGKSNITIYTNEIDGVIQTTDMTVTCATDKSSDKMDDSLKATSSNRGVVRVSVTEQPKKAEAAKGNKGTCTATLTLTPVANGKATVTVASIKNPKKTKKITVTVKTWAKDIAFSGPVKTIVDENGNPVVGEDGKEQKEIVLANQKGSKLNLGAYVSTPNVSNAKLTYKVTNVNEKGSIACDAKGNVSVKKVGASGEVTITSVDKDGAGPKVSEIVKVETVKNEKEFPLVTTIKIAPDRLADKSDKKSTSTKLADLGYGRVSSNSKQLYLKGNKGSANNTYQLNCVVDAAASMNDLAFSSNKPAVATVDDNGKITAVGNGKATITVTAKMGNNAKKATLNVTVDTDVEYVNVASTRFTILANNKDTAQINATTNGNAKTKKVTYRISSITFTESGTSKTEETEPNNKGKWVWKNNKFKPAQYISVDGKGNVKAKKECVATIIAETSEMKTRDDGTKVPVASATITVTAEDSVTALTLLAEGKGEYAEGKPNAKDLEIKKNTKTQHPTKITAYRTGKDDGGKLKLSTNPTWLSATPAAEKPLKAEDVTWTSNKPAVATVDGEGNVTLVGNGTAKITAKAKSGKSTSTTITVKTDAYEITSVAKVIDGVIYVNDFEGKKTPASIINASVNPDASSKTLTYSEKKAVAIADIPEQGLEVKVTAAKRNSAATPTERTFRIKKDASNPDSGYTILADGKEVEGTLELKVGESRTLKAVKKGTNTVLADVKWGIENKGPVTINATTGVVKAVAEVKSGKEDAVIKVGETATIKVVVGRKDAAVQNEINKSFKTKLNEENRDYTGVSAKFNEKSRAVQMNILNPTKDIESLEETGLVAAMREVAINSFNNKLIFDKVVITNNSKEYIVTNSSTLNPIEGTISEKVTLKDDDGTERDFDDLGKAVRAVLGKHGSRVQDLNGESYNIALNLHYFGAPSLTYEVVYTADVSMSAVNYDALVDAKIQRAVEVFNTKLEEAGDNGVTVEAGSEKETLTKDMMSVAYNPAANEIDVTIEDLDVAYDKFNEYSKKYADATFEKLWSEANEKWQEGVTVDGVEVGSDEKNEAKTYAKDIAGDLSSVTLAFTSANGQRAVDSLSRKELEDHYATAEETKKEFVKNVLEHYFDQLKNAGTPYEDLDGVAGSLGNLVGSVASANVTFTVGKQTYTQSYKVNFLVSYKAYDKAADKRINAKVDEKKADLEAKKFVVDYDDKSNNLTIDIRKRDSIAAKEWDLALNLPLTDILDAESDRLNEILASMVGYDEKYGPKVSKANVVVNDMSTVLVDGDKNYTIDENGAENLLKALVETKKVGKETQYLTKLRDMDGRTATLKVTYHIDQINRDVTLVYTIKFTVEGAKESKTKTSEALSVDEDKLVDDEEADEETVQDETGEETEDETDGTTEDETDGTTEDETDGTTEDETDGTTEDETDGTTEDGTDGTTESDADGAVESETATETPADTTAEADQTVDTVVE